MTPPDDDLVTASEIARAERTVDPLAAARAARADQVRASHAPTTRRAYAADWAAFRAWCAEHAATDPSLVPLPASDATLSLYVGHLDAKRPTTVRRALSAIRLAHARAGVALPDEAYPATLAAVRGHAHRHADAPPRQMRAAVDGLVQRLADACDPASAFGARDRALLLVGFDGAFRRSELVGIDVEHLTRTAEGLHVRLGPTKRDQRGRGATVAVLARPDSPWCPVAALEHWLELGARTSGPVFVALRGANHVRRPGQERLSDRAVARIVKSAAAACGLEGAFGAHSLRRGLVTSAIEAGVSPVQVMRHARHRSLSTTLAYAESANALADHPRVGLRGPGACPEIDTDPELPAPLPVSS